MRKSLNADGQRRGSSRAAASEVVPSVERRVRRVVTECLGTDADELSTDVSLTDDLAADSLDLIDLAMALEAEFVVVVPDVVLDGTRTYGDLVDAVDMLVRASRTARAHGPAREVGIPGAMVRETAAGVTMEEKS